MSEPQVLVVEDETLICALLMEALEDEGVVAACASTGTEAVSKLADGSAFKVLITDVNLGPGPDGFDVALRARELFPDLFVIYVTGHAELDVETRGVPGAMLIPKPYSPITLAERIAALAPLVGRY